MVEAFNKHGAYSILYFNTEVLHISFLNRITIISLE